MIGYDLDRGGPKDSETAPNSFLTKINGKGFWRFGTDLCFLSTKKPIEEKCVSEPTRCVSAKKTKDDNDEDEDEEASLAMSAPARPKRRWFVMWLEADLGVECWELLFRQESCKSDKKC